MIGTIVSHSVANKKRQDSHDKWAGASLEATIPRWGILWWSCGIPDLISTSDTIAVLAIDEVVAAYGCCIHPKSETDQRASFAISLIAMNTHWKLLRSATKKGGDHCPPASRKS